MGGDGSEGHLAGLLSAERTALKGIIIFSLRWLGEWRGQEQLGGSGSESRRNRSRYIFLAPSDYR